MVKVSINKPDNYVVSNLKVKQVLSNALREGGITSDCSVSVAFVGEQQMEELVDKYYKGDPQKKYVHPILTFPSLETKGKFVLPKGQSAELGEIIISYPEAIRFARESGETVEKRILFLLQHGAEHLLGHHHN